MKYLYLINPFEWIKASKFAKKESKFDKSQYDLELYLYSKILTSNMLHYGYFEDTTTKSETISIKQFEDAQIRYAENIIEYIKDIKSPILDVGCGTGGLSDLISKKNLSVESLSPNKNQIDFIHKNLKHLKTRKCKFEQFESSTKYGTVINSESLQYIVLDDAFKKLDDIILAGSRWIIVDYFRRNNTGTHKSGHNLEDFRKKLKTYHWTIVKERDITSNILPSVSFFYMYAERIFLPIKHFAFEKLRFKKPKLYYMTGNIRESIDKKIKKEIAGIDPNQFVKEKAYMFFVLEKTEH